MRQQVDMLLEPLDRCPLQAYVEAKVQLFDIIDWVLHQIGPASILISTFTTSEEFLRHMYIIRGRGLVKQAIMLADLRGAQKTRALYKFMSSAFDKVYLTENHSKVLLFNTGSRQVTVVTSQNQTRGNRTESAVVTTDPRVYLRLTDKFNDIINNKAILLDGVFRGNDEAAV